MLFTYVRHMFVTTDGVIVFNWLFLGRGYAPTPDHTPFIFIYFICLYLLFTFSGMSKHFW